MAGDGKLEDELIREFSGEDDMRKVELLVLRGLGLKDVTALKNVPCLTSLSLSHNSIEGIDLAPNALPHLVEMNINNNMLTSLSWIRCCPKIEKLYASCNKIQDVDPLATCESLEFIGLHGNNLKDLDSCLKILKGLPRLIDLEIDGNECSLVSGYRHVVIDQLQQIMRLDGTSILSADRENARNILKFNERQPTEVNSNRSSRNEQHDDNDNGDDKVSFWTHSEIDVPPPSSRPSSARRPATSHQNSAQYRLSNTNISTDAKQLSKVLAAKSSEYLQGPQKKMMAGLNEDENAQSDSQMFKVTENANFLNSNPILLEYLAEAAAGEEEEESVPEDVNHKEGGEAQTMLEKNFVSDGIMFVDSSAPNANGHAHHNGFDDNSASHSMRHDRPSSRRRVGFANELRKVTSAMSAVEAFSIEEIVEMMNTAKHADSQSLGEMLSEFAMGTAGQSPPQTNQRPTNKSDEMIIRRLLKTIEKLQSKLALLESGSMPQEGNVNIDSLKKEIATLKIENTNMYHLQEENVSLRKQLKEIHERWNDNKLREQNSRLKTQVKHYKAQCQRLREESAKFGRPMTSAGVRARESRETESLLAEVDEYDSELAELVRRNVAMLSEIQEDIQELQSVPENEHSHESFE